MYTPGVRPLLEADIITWFDAVPFGAMPVTAFAVSQAVDRLAGITDTVHAPLPAKFTLSVAKADPGAAGVLSVTRFCAAESAGGFVAGPA